MLQLGESVRTPNGLIGRVWALSSQDGLCIVRDDSDELHPILSGWISWTNVTSVENKK